MTYQRPTVICYSRSHFNRTKSLNKEYHSCFEYFHKWRSNKNENIAVWSAVFTRAQSFISHRFEVFEVAKFGVHFLFILIHGNRLLICHITFLAVHPFPWAMFSSITGKTSLFRLTLVGIGGVGCCLLWKAQNRNSSVNVVLAKSSDHGQAQTRRKTKFDQFASIEVDGQYFMTPADFLESVMNRDLPGDDHLAHRHTHTHYMYMTREGGFEYKKGGGTRRLA